MTIWRTRVRGVVVVGIGLVTMAVPAGLGHAAAPNPADRLFDRARHAVHAYEFSGSVRIWWRDASGGHQTTVAVAARRGALDVARGRIFHEAGEAWMRRDRAWITLWGERRDLPSPSVTPKYRVSTDSGPHILGRATDQITVRRQGQRVEIVDFDHQTGVVLRRERFDRSGASDLRMEFVAFTGLRTRVGPSQRPVRAAEADPGTRRKAPPGVARSVGDGFQLIEARSMTDNAIQLRYSDGVFEASVFAQPGETDWTQLPGGGQDVRYGTVRARRYRTPTGTVLVWQAGDRTLTCVTDATASDQAAMISSLSREDDGLWTGLARFVNGPFHWS